LRSTCCRRPAPQRLDEIAVEDVDRFRRTKVREGRLNATSINKCLALLATLVLAGLRIDEALSLRWQHVDLAGGRLRIAGTRTDAAARVVDLLPLLRDGERERLRALVDGLDSPPTGTSGDQDGVEAVGKART
jgi:integrase